MAHMTQRRCKCCGDTFMARTADVNRGWAKFCSKSCKAIHQERRTGQYRAYQERRDSRYDDPRGGGIAGPYGGSEADIRPDPHK